MRPRIRKGRDRGLTSQVRSDGISRDLLNVCQTVMNGAMGVSCRISLSIRVDAPKKLDLPINRPAVPGFTWRQED
jgi:hypothetical protein